jgi:hypothetical protein
MALEHQAAALEAEHGELWTRPLANLIPAARLRHVIGTSNAYEDTTVREVVNHFRFRRGFVEEVTLSAADLIQHGPDLFRLAPLRDLTLRELGGGLDRLAALPCLAPVEAIRVPHAPLDADDWSELCQGLYNNPHLARLMTLDLGRSQLALRRLLASRLLERVGRLGLDDCDLEDDDVFLLARHATAAGITHLDLSRNDLGDDSLIAIAESPHLKDLKVLRVEIEAGDGFTAAGMVPLATSPNLYGLTSLNLNGYPADAEPDGPLHLANSPHHTQLTALQLANGQIGPSLIAELVAGPALARLTHLVLGTNDIGPKGLRAVLTSPCSRMLNYLDVSDTCCGDNLAKTLAGVSVSQLHYLHLAGNYLDDAGAIALAAVDLPQLTHLDLSQCEIGDAGARAIAESPGLGGLYFLNLSQSNFESESAALLQRRFGDRVVV